MGTSEGTFAVVLAGGQGTRIRHLHPDLPKPMIPVAGRPFLEWVLRWLRGQGIARAFVSTGHLGHVIDAWVASAPIPGMSLATASESRPLGTAGGFLNALDATATPFSEAVVANGDSIAVADLAPLLTALRAGADAAILGVEVEDASRYGTLEVAGERLTAFREKRPGAALVNAGIYAFSRRTVAGLPRRAPLSFETDVFPDLLAKGGVVRVARAAAPFLDIGIPESLARAEAFARDHLVALAAPD